MVTSLPGSAVAGATFIVTGLAANTSFKWLLHGHASVRPMLEREWPAWVALGLLLAGLFGALGWGAGLAAAALLASGLAEAIAAVVGILPWGTPFAFAVLVLTAATAAVVLRGLTSRQGQVAAAGVVAFAFAGLMMVPVLQRLVPVA